MLKSALISGALAFLFILVASLLTPFCAFCVSLFTGLLAGYLTGVFEKPPAEQLTKRTALAGAIAGAFGFFASMAGAVINAFIAQNPEFQINRLLGLPPADPTTVWIASLVLNFCIGLFNIGFHALLGIGGGVIWKNTAGKQAQASPL